MKMTYKRALKDFDNKIKLKDESDFYDKCLFWKFEPKGKYKTKHRTEQSLFTCVNSGES